MNLVDTSGWLEYFREGPNARFFAPPIEDGAKLVVSAISMYEVLKAYLLENSLKTGLERLEFMRRGSVVEVDGPLAAAAAHLSVAHKLAMADSLILASAQARKAALWTQDADFEGIAGVRYAPKAKG